MTNSMHRRTAAIFVAMIAAAAAIAEGPKDFSLSSGDATFRLADHRGHFVVLHFLLKTECPYCMRHVTDHVANAPRMAGVIHVFIKPDTDAEIAEWSKKLAETDVKAVIYRDPDAKLATEFGVPDGYAFHNQTVHFPALIVLGPDGKEIWRHVGKDNSDRVSYETLAAQLGPRLRSADLDQYNLGKDQLAIQGYDPLTYFQGEPREGRAEVTSLYRGATYRFVNEDNRRKFAEAPEKFAPQYGGWCATAMADGGRKVEIDPRNYKVTNGRLFLFYKGWLGDALKDWSKDEPGQTQKADAAWQKIAPTDTAAKR